MKNINLRIFDWSGKKATGDDLLNVVTRELINKTANALNHNIRFKHFIRYNASVVGGGTILGHGVFFKRIARRIFFDQKPFMVFGTGARMPQRELNQKEQDLLNKFCDKSMLLGVRGERTKKWLEYYGISNVDVIGDTALAFKPVMVQYLHGDFRVGVSIRYMGGGLRPEEQLNSNKQNAILFAEICDGFIREYKATLYFIDFCKNRFDSDFTGIQMIKKFMKEKKGVEESKLLSFDSNKNPVEGFSRLGKMDFILSQRLHPSLIGWVLGVPSIGLDYQFNKTADALEPLGLGKFVIDISQINSSLFMEKVKKLIDHRMELVNLVSNNRNILIEKQKKMMIDFIESNINSVKSIL